MIPMSFCNHISEIISAVTGIIGVIIGSIITYCIETKRRKNDENNKILRKIYFQIYTELEYCYLSQNGILKGHDGAKNVSVADVKIQLKRLLEDNTEILDSGLFEIYHNIKSEQYFEYDITGSIADFKYLKLYAFLLKKMIGMQKKAKMTDKYFMKRLKYLYYQYLTWFNLMKYLMDWEQVEDILVQSFLFKRSFKSIANGASG